jgi:hypothetical protein
MERGKRKHGMATVLLLMSGLLGVLHLYLEENPNVRVFAGLYSLVVGMEVGTAMSTAGGTTAARATPVEATGVGGAADQDRRDHNWEEGEDVAEDNRGHGGGKGGGITGSATAALVAVIRCVLKGGQKNVVLTFFLCFVISIHLKQCDK